MNRYKKMNGWIKKLKMNKKMFTRLLKGQQEAVYVAAKLLKKIS